MKKLVIPSILAATVLVAAVFAIVQVEKVSTVHTSIGTERTIVKDGVSLNPGDGATLSTTVIAASAGQSFAGHYFLTATNLGTTDLLNTLTVRCEVSAGVNVDHVFTASPVDHGFSCLSLSFIITDIAGGDNAPPAVIDATVQFKTSTSVTTQTTD